MLTRLINYPIYITSRVDTLEVHVPDVVGGVLVAEVVSLLKEPRGLCVVPVDLEGIPPNGVDRSGMTLVSSSH